MSNSTNGFYLIFLIFKGMLFLLKVLLAELENLLQKELASKGAVLVRLNLFL
jgi:hypothetical protein